MECRGYSLNKQDSTKCLLIVSPGETEFDDTGKNAVHFKDYGISKENTQANVDNLYYRSPNIRSSVLLSGIKLPSTLYECVNRCSSDPVCSAFSYSPENGGHVQQLWRRICNS